MDERIKIIKDKTITFTFSTSIIFLKVLSNFSEAEYEN